MQYQVLENLRHDGQDYHDGDVVELDAEVGKTLALHGVVKQRVVRGNEPKSDDDKPVGETTHTQVGQDDYAVTTYASRAPTRYTKNGKTVKKTEYEAAVSHQEEPKGSGSEQAPAEPQQAPEQPNGEE